MRNAIPNFISGLIFRIMLDLSRRLFFGGLTYLYIICLSACVQSNEKQKTADTDSISKKDYAVHGYFSEQQVLHTDSNELKTFFLNYPLLKDYADDVMQFYGYRQFRSAWYDAAGLSEQASNLYSHLCNLELEGIMTPVPYKNILDSLMENQQADTIPNRNAEILLTAEYFYYADKVWHGIPEKSTTKLEWFLPRKKLNLPLLMDSLLKESNAPVFSGHYNFRQYNLLKSQLRKYRQLDSLSWIPINPGTGVPLRKSDTAETIRDIRHRLYLLGDLSADTRTNRFDDDLETAVKSFQERNGLPADGNMGAGFFRELNIPPGENIRRLIVNMERSRWIPDDLSKQYLIINIPAFTLTAFNLDTPTLKMNVVVGKSVNKTVIFSGDITYIVFSPYWNVPPSILKKEVLPAIKKDPDYLRRNNMEWNGNSVRQKPGPKNSLGLVKFLFPNSYNIYLHDSPAKSLFGAQTRAFSHGCIRVAEPKKLAVYLLRDDPQWNEEKISKAMHAGKEKYVTLSQPVPVYIGYFTAWVDNQGKLNFRNDIYNRDHKLEEMLIKK
jgi:L,D-transpeptidase YcbB